MENIHADLRVLRVKLKQVSCSTNLLCWEFSDKI